MEISIIYRVYLILIHLIDEEIVEVLDEEIVVVEIIHQIDETIIDEEIVEVLDEE